MKAFLVGMGLVLALALVGCGSGSSSAPKASSGDHASAKASASAAAARVEYRTCKKAVGALLAAEQQLNDRLNVGLQFTDYTSRLGDVSVAYNGTVSAVKSTQSYRQCVNTVALPLQRAFKDYQAAGTIWNNCNQSFSCTFDKGTPELKKAQAKWTSASVALSSAKQALDTMAP